MLNLNAVHYVSTLLDGIKLESTRDRDEPFNIKLGQGEFLDFYLFYLNFRYNFVGFTLFLVMKWKCFKLIDEFDRPNCWRA